VIAMRSLFALMLLTLTACGVVTEQGVYEGIRQQQQIRREPSPPDNQRLPDYDKFKQERDKLKPSPE
jgi:hypothetical protein